MSRIIISVTTEVAGQIGLLFPCIGDSESIRRSPVLFVPRVFLPLVLCNQRTLSPGLPLTRFLR